MPLKKTPQQKKMLSLERDRRNVFGENDKSSRKNIAAGKQRQQQSARRSVNQSLALNVPHAIELDSAEQIQFSATTAIILGERKRFRKRPDAALGSVLAKKQTRDRGSYKAYGADLNFRKK